MLQLNSNPHVNYRKIYFKVNFYKKDQIISEVIRYSGRPGYLSGKPVIIGNLDQVTNSVDQTSIKPLEIMSQSACSDTTKLGCP